MEPGDKKNLLTEPAASHKVEDESENKVNGSLNMMGDNSTKVIH